MQPDREEDDEMADQFRQQRLDALSRRCPYCNRAPGHYCAGDGMHMARVYVDGEMLHFPGLDLS